MPLGNLLWPSKALLGGLWAAITLKNIRSLTFFEWQLFAALELLMALSGHLGAARADLEKPKLTPKENQR